MLPNARSALWIATLLAWSACGLAAQKAPPDAQARSPVQVTSTFYRWYIAKYRSDHDPMLELRAEPDGRLSTALLDELDARMAEDPAGPDYFLQADDTVRPCRSLDASLLSAAPSTAQVEVTLGSRQAAPWRVRVSLSREGDAWRIGEVERDPRRPPARAARRALGDC